MSTGFTLIVPLKPPAVGKSRLAAVGPLRERLALAFALDTVAAALGSPEVHRVLVVCDDAAAGAALAALGAEVVPDAPGGGLNAALAFGAEQAHGWRAALSADLPALRERELTEVLGAARGAGRSFLADAHGVGTTLLAAAPDVPLAPRFGGPSRIAHRASGASELTLAAATVRLDVDTPEDLTAATSLGLGPRTAELLRCRSLAMPR
ncbi:2-phospho-L-lactate guanylyltransferase [Streptacidiphilus monticola]|uniref:Phosphoenolpyruvate guanylyltransferase n=1 Tax=Streptacidiphilus monticola TaxID=2161674 RepID=A0ABW1FZL9_9ACTN